MTNGDRSRAKAILMAACAALAFLPTATYAQQRSQEVRYNIAAQDLGTALTEFARQSNQEIYFSADLTRGKRAPRLSGTLTIEQALRRLLSGSGLTFRVKASGSIVIELEDRARGTQADGEDTDGSPGAVAEILVTGERPTMNADIRRSKNDAQPYVVFTAEDIQRSGASSLDDFLAARVTSNGQRGPSGTGIVGTSNAGSVALRGLLGQTVILVDGRPMPAVSNGASFGQPNLTGILSSSIERIEILPSSASGIYGGGATGGVINVILKRTYSGLDLNAEYGSTFDGHAGRYLISARGGASLFNGSARVSASYARSSESSLLRSDRNLLQPARVLQFTNYPQGFSTFPPVGSTPNICAASVSGTFYICNGANLTFDNGTPVGSSIASVPLGYAGPSTDGGVAFKATAGRYNLSDPGDGTTIYSEPAVDAATLNFRANLTSSVEVFADGRWTQTKARGSQGSTIRLGLPANDPNNPFQQAIAVSFATDDAQSIRESKTRALNTVLGGVFRIKEGWSLSGEYTYGENDSTTRAIANPALSSAGIALLAGTSTRDQALVITDLSSYINRAYDQTATVHTAASNYKFRFNSTPIRLPGGAVSLQLVAERNNEVMDPSVSVAAGASTYNSGKSRRSDSAYGEVRVPILSPEMHFPLGRSLEVTGAVRYDHYVTNTAANVQSPPTRFENTLGSTNYTLALRYEPFTGLMLRGSYATGFYPPIVQALVPTSTSLPAAFYPYMDPRRGNQLFLGNASGSLSLTYGGNPNLLPETSKSTSLGFVLQPSFLPDLRFSADYTHIRKTNELFAGIQVPALLANEGIFPGRVVRGANLPGDPVGWAGPVVGVDISPVNAAHADIEAVDFQFDMKIPVGTLAVLRPRAIATWTKSFKRQVLAADPVYNVVGLSDGGAPLKWRISYGASLERGPLELDWNAEFFDKYSVGYGDPALASQVPILIAGQGNGGIIPSQTYHNFSISYQLPKAAPLSGGRLYLSIFNVFDTRPPIVATNSTLGGYSFYGDPRLRRFVLGISSQF